MKATAAAVPKKTNKVCACGISSLDFSIHFGFAKTLEVTKLFKSITQLIDSSTLPSYPNTGITFASLGDSLGGGFTIQHPSSSLAWCFSVQLNLYPLIGITVASLGDSLGGGFTIQNPSSSLAWCFSVQLNLYPLIGITGASLGDSLGGGFTIQNPSSSLAWCFFV